ncbi:LolA family protein [Ectobacillus ponti]|uniref:Outer membrane lipoprotein carrier protein LolA n=1 Tax=Ectobacillus ponti TaxID=2961894 RepID=A0AA41XE37_9BACI|nr:outer membrane lipoprotein carrier protein LolA [Ectobacillus ponti]
MQKSKEDVIKDLEAKVSDMKSYEAKAKLSIKTGAEPQVYDVDIWHSKPSYYRVSLKNAKKDQSQIILRNDEGVFVLTPALNKSFRFQSNWPQNSSQAYLYESLVRDVLKDKEAAVFKATDDNYVFETKTNYQNHNMIPKQEIAFSKKDLSPVSVKLMDNDNNVLVQVDFSGVKFDKKFDKGAFDTKKNMSVARDEIPASAQQDQPFAVLYPNDLPKGVVKKEEKEMKTANGKRVILTYNGNKKSFTLIQEKALVAKTGTTVSMSGEPVDLGFTVGALTKDSITWSHNGVDYMLVSKELSQDELLTVARSVYQKAEK